MNWIKAPRMPRPNRKGRGKPTGIKVPVGVAAVVGGGMVALTMLAHGASIDDGADQAPFRPETVAVAEPVATYQAPYGGLACGVDLDCSWVEHHQAAAAAKAAKKPAKPAGEPAVTRSMTVEQGSGGRTITESITVRTDTGTVTTTVRRGPKGATVTRRVTSR